MEPPCPGGAVGGVVYLQPSQIERPGLQGHMAQIRRAERPGLKVRRA